MSYTKAFSSKRSQLLLLVAAIAVTLAIALSAADSARASEVDDNANRVVSSVSPEQQAQAGEPDANLEYLFAVFIITWAAFFAYTFYMSRRQREMRKEIDALRRALVDRERRMIEADTLSE